MSIDGLLVVDKPSGLTSHDVVGRVRRLLRERRIGHTGTLDPDATGVLGLVIGRATRLAQFMGADEKAYDARVQLGTVTDTDDSSGTVVGTPFEGSWPSRAEVETALERLRGPQWQRPPAYSAKKIDGRRAYAIARAQSRGEVSAPPVVKPAQVSLFEVGICSYDDGVLQLALRCSAGFYVRALARDLGEQLGTGGHLAALRRTRSGPLTLAQSHPLAELEADASRAADRLVPLSQLLPHLPAVRLTSVGVTRAAHGARLGPSDIEPVSDLARALAQPDAVGVRLLSPVGALVAIAQIDRDRGSEALHPSVVLM